MPGEMKLIKTIKMIRVTAAVKAIGAAAVKMTPGRRTALAIRMRAGCVFMHPKRATLAICLL